MDNMADFESKNPGVTVEDVVTPFAEYHQKLMTVAASGSDEFDVVFVESDYVAQMGEAGVLEPLNAYVENSETMSWDDYIESVVQRNCIDGTYYAMADLLWKSQVTNGSLLLVVRSESLGWSIVVNSAVLSTEII